jgi:hypothetical protein
MARPQDIIDLIDVGLQTPAPDPTYGEVSPTNQETCARCHRPPADESDWCEGCRAFLLGDREDPREAGRPGGWEQALRQIDHICGDPRCVNPDHLVTVTPRENLEWPADSLGGQVARIGREMEAMYQRALADLAQHPERFTDEMRQDLADFEAVMPPHFHHVHAAICPRHGETRGGTCRRCR